MHTARSIFVLAVLAIGVAAAPVAAQLPELPAVDRSVALIEDNASRYPHLPPLRTSADGRIGLNIKSLQLFLIAPERLSVPFLGSPDGVTMLASNTGIQLANSDLHTYTSDFNVQHAALCDLGRTPQPCSAGSPDDCYAIAVITPVTRANTVELWKTDLVLRVTNPKTAAAQMTIDSKTSPAIGPIHPANTLFETMITADGRLLVARVNNSHDELPGVDIVYSAAPINGQPCNIDAWDELKPITSAHAELGPRYGFSTYPLRDPAGDLIPAGQDLHATYPWIDRHGRNLFFTTVGSTLWYRLQGGQTFFSRYPVFCVPGEDCAAITQDNKDDHDDVTDTRGVSMAGLWTHGKVVMLDGIVNNIDYGMKVEAIRQRMAQLYAPNSGPVGNESGQVRIGTGRQSSEVEDFPPGFVNNITFIDSIEQLFNANPHTKPLTPRDVVWLVDTGHASDEVIFDDWVTQNSLIVSEMVGAMAWTGGWDPNRFDYFDGFERVPGAGAFVGVGFTNNQPRRVQNTATSTEWSTPRWGQIFGGARLEPVALGGIHGRGLWLDGASGIDYAIPLQTHPVTTTYWFAGLFVDCRFDDDATRRDLLVFSDGTRLQIEGRDIVRYVNSAGTDVVTYTLTAAQRLPFRGWAHLGLLIHPGGSHVDLYLNGDRIKSWSSLTQHLFQPVAGSLYVGKQPGNTVAGFRGWIDEFKLLAENPGEEVVCNHARGTIIQQQPGGGPPPPNLVRYCFHDYTVEQPGAHLKNIPSGFVSKRREILFPEGPLHYNQPRPDSSNNSFCLSCHVGTQATASLRVDALLPNPALMMQDDPRRQPLQPPALIYGHIPADLYGPGVPASPIVAPQEGAQQDQWAFP